MADDDSRDYAAPESRRRRSQRRDPVDSRPDRLAMWAVVMAVVAMLAAAASARAETPGAPSDADARTPAPLVINADEPAARS